MKRIALVQLMIVFAVVIAVSNTQTVNAGDLPAWLKQASSATAPAYEKDVHAVVLLNEQQLNLGSDGELVTTENYGVRLLTREGRRYAVARAYYLLSASK